MARDDAQRREQDALGRAAKDTALAVPGAIMKGAPVLQQQLGQPGFLEMRRAGSIGAGIVDRTVQGTRLLGAGAQGGWGGAATEAVQLGMEEGVGYAGDKAARFLAKRAILGGTGATTAAGALGLSFSAGTLVGGYMRDSTYVGQEWFGLSGTVGDEVDNAWFRYSPDWVKEAASGTPQIDIDSADYLRAQQRQINAGAHRAYERIARQNEESLRQRDAERAAEREAERDDDAERARQSGGGAGLGTMLMLQSLNAANVRRQAQQQQSARQPAASSHREQIPSPRGPAYGESSKEFAPSSSTHRREVNCGKGVADCYR